MVWRRGNDQNLLEGGLKDPKADGVRFLVGFW